MFRHPCKRLVKYDGISLDLSGLTGPEQFKVTLGQLQIRRELLQAATDIILLYDAVQYSNCVRVQQMPRDSPERIKMIYRAEESERQIVLFMLLVRLMIALPNSERLQKALVDWVAAHVVPAQELTSEAQKAELRFGIPRLETDSQIPNLATVSSHIESAEKAEPSLRQAIRSKVSFDMDEVLAMLEGGQEG
jgi:hypothetical protein